MKKLYITFAVVAALVVVGILYADTSPVAGEKVVPIHQPITDSTDVSVLRSIYEEFVDPQNHSGCTVEFTTTSIFKNVEGELDTTRVDGVYAASSSRMQILTDSLSVYGDNRVMIAVLPYRKELYLTSLDDIDYKKVKHQMVGMALESMFDEGNVIENIAVRVSSGSLASSSTGKTADRKLVVEPGSEIVKRLGIRQITVVFNRDERTLRDVLVEYAPDVRQQSTRMQYDTFRWEEVPESFSTPLFQSFFDENKRLLPKWEGYTVTDRRYRVASSK